MTWTYNGDPAESTTTAVRFLVGDTDTNDQQMTDEEIEYLLDLCDDDPNVAAVRACRGLSAKYARQVNTTNGALSVGAADRAAHYRELASELSAQLSRGVMPFAGGLTQTGKETLASESDATQPAFAIGMDDRPGAGSIFDYDEAL